MCFGWSHLRSRSWLLGGGGMCLRVWRGTEFGEEGVVFPFVLVADFHIGLRVQPVQSRSRGLRVLLLQLLEIHDVIRV